MTINAGDLDQRLQIQADAAPARGEAGESQPAWTTIASVWASVKPTTGKQIVIGGAVAALGSALITLRWRPDVALSPLLRFYDQARGVAWQINHVADIDNAHREWQCVCTQVM